MDHKLTIKKWSELTSLEFDQMNLSHKREWGITQQMTPEGHSQNIFFLLKGNNDQILAQGQLVPINDIKFNGETFDILGIGGIIANRKKQGYGREIMHSIRDYLLEHEKSGVGFIGLPDFYKKCGFMTDKEAIKRFVFEKDGIRSTNIESSHVCYLDGQDNFMQKVLLQKDKDVFLPREPDW